MTFDKLTFLQKRVSNLLLAPIMTRIARSIQTRVTIWKVYFHDLLLLLRLMGTIVRHMRNPAPYDADRPSRKKQRLI